MECTQTYFDNKWGCLLIKEVISIFEVQWSNLPNDMVVVNVKMLTEYSLPT